MNIITPIFIPVSQSKSKCPHCHKDEDVKEVCRNCGYEYKDDDNINFLDVVKIILFILFACWFIITIVLWLSPMYGQGNPTLWEVIKMQWQWISNKHIF